MACKHNWVYNAAGLATCSKCGKKGEFQHLRIRRAGDKIRNVNKPLSLQKIRPEDNIFVLGPAVKVVPRFCERCGQVRVYGAQRRCPRCAQIERLGSFRVVPSASTIPTSKKACPYCYGRDVYWDAKAKAFMCRNCKRPFNF